MVTFIREFQHREDSLARLFQSNLAVDVALFASTVAASVGPPAEGGPVAADDQLTE